MLIRYPKPQVGTEEKALTRRIIALFLDTLIAIFIVGALFFIRGSTILELSEEKFFLFFGLPAIIIEFFYYIFLEGFMGQTIGKKIMKIVVVKEDGSRCTYLAAFIRNLLRIVDALIPLGNSPTYLIGGITVLLTKRKQRIGDLIAKTVVVKVAPENKDERNP